VQNSTCAAASSSRLRTQPKPRTPVDQELYSWGQGPDWASGPVDMGEWSGWKGDSDTTRPKTPEHSAGWGTTANDAGWDNTSDWPDVSASAKVDDKKGKQKKKGKERSGKEQDMGNGPPLSGSPRATDNVSLEIPQDSPGPSSWPTLAPDAPADNTNVAAKRKGKGKQENAWGLQTGIRSPFLSHSTSSSSDQGWGTVQVKKGKGGTRGAQAQVQATAKVASSSSASQATEGWGNQESWGSW
jgi:hypothetical protein